MAGHDDDVTVEGSAGGDAVRLLMLERMDRDLYRNRFSEYRRDDHLYGGQVLSQALAAATASVDGLPVHSLHGYFLRAGSARHRVVFHVERSRDGRRFATRRVVATQDARPIFHMDCSFTAGEAGFAHREAIPPDVPPPETLPTFPEAADILADRIPAYMATSLRHPRLIEGRLVDPEQLVRHDPTARRRFWIRVASGRGHDDPAVHQQLLAYLSDYFLAATALAPHPIRIAGPELFMASLDHAMWFHAPARADDWLLYDCHSPWAGSGRGLARGSLYTRNGDLVASTAQEALMRLT